MLKLMLEKYSYFLYPILFAILGGCIYGPSLVDSKPLWDDNHFLFESTRFLQASSFIEFFAQGKSTARSWPLTYSFLWGIYHFFSANYFVYKLINLFFHILNAFLVFKLLGQVNRGFSLILALIFLVHPGQVESVSWIFQLSTLASTTFLLLTIYYCSKLLKAHSNNKYLTLSGAFFLISLLFKVTAILLPIFILFYLYTYKSFLLKKKHVVLWLVLLFSLSAWRGSLTMGGAVNTPIEKRSSHHYLVFDKMHQATLSHSFLSQTKKNSITNKYDGRSLIQKAAAKIHLVLSSFGHYLTNLYSSENLFFYAKTETLSLVNTFQGILFLGVTLFIILFKKFKLFHILSSFILFLCLYIPISGIFYIPYMKYSFVADHWFYAPLIGLLMMVSILMNKIDKTVYIKSLKVLFLFSILNFSYSSFNYSQLFSSPVDLLTHNIKHNPKQSFLYILVSEFYYKKSDYVSGIKILESWPDKEHIDILNMKLFGYLKLANYEFASKTLFKLAEKAFVAKNNDLVESYFKLLMKVNPKSRYVNMILDRFY